MILRKIIFGLTCLLLGSCHSLDSYKKQQATMDIKQYFTGPIKAWGIIQDWKGTVVTQFDIDMVGTWNGDVGTLKEDFSFYDGKKQQRVWTIHKLADGSYEGTAPDVEGKATGGVMGSAARWSYEMDLPLEEKTYRITFDDWMWAMNDGVLINRSYLRKFGITVSELTIFMQKQPTTEKK